MFVEEDSEQYTDRFNILDNEVGQVFVCLFLCLLKRTVSSTQTGSTFLITRLVKCLFVCLFLCLLKRTASNTQTGSTFLITRLVKCLFVCLFVCLFLCLLKRTASSTPVHRQVQHS